MATIEIPELIEMSRAIQSKVVTRIKDMGYTDQEVAALIYHNDERWCLREVPSFYLDDCTSPQSIYKMTAFANTFDYMVDVDLKVEWPA